MKIFRGLLMVAIGAFLLFCGLLKSNFIIYRFLVTRSQLFWGEGDKVHIFYVIVGAIIIVFGILFAIGIFNKQKN